MSTAIALQEEMNPYVSLLEAIKDILDDAKVSKSGGLPNEMYLTFDAPKSKKKYDALVESIMEKAHEMHEENNEVPMCRIRRLDKKCFITFISRGIWE